MIRLPNPKTKHCKTCGVQHTRQTSSFCKKCASEYQQQRRIKLHEKRGEQKCPVCKTWQKYSEGHACPTCIENAMTRTLALRAKTQAARDARMDKLFEESMNDEKECSTCHVIKPIDDFYLRSIKDEDGITLGSAPRSTCKSCDREYQAKKRNPVDLSEYLPWRILKYPQKTKHVYIATLSAHSVDRIIKRMEDKNGELRVNPGDTRLYVYAQTGTGKLYYDCPTLEGCLARFSNDFIVKGDQQCT